MNIMRFKFLSLLLLAILVTVAVSCSEDEPPLPDNEASFSASELGFADDEAQATITINLTRAASEDKVLTVSFVSTGVTYGVEFTTTPAATSNSFELTIPAGSREVSFTVNKVAGIFLEGDESIQFTIQSIDKPFVLDDAVTVNLSFSQIVSTGGTMQLQGLIAAEPGSSAGNTVFVDLSANVQSSVARMAWDLGFYSGSDFRVILNHASAASAVMVNKTDINQVTAADVTASDLAIGFASGSFSAYDSINGNLDHTAISEISAIETENKVWVINRVGGSGAAQPSTAWYKIRVLRNGEGYTLQYAQVDANTFTSVNIAKNTLLNFSYFSFGTGAVTVEPVKTNWDFQWSWSIYYTSTDGENVPYAFSDLVFINHHNDVKADTVFTADVTYAAFTAANLVNYDLVSDRDVIGSGWRVTSPGGPDPIGVRTDRFYIIEDSQGNVYKLRFVNFHANDGGTRGKPNIEYALVKKADD